MKRNSEVVQDDEGKRIVVTIIYNSKGGRISTGIV